MLPLDEIERRARLETQLITEEEIPGAFAESREAARSCRHLFSGIRTFVMFIGYPRSGHSLIGSLLDAHPHMIVAHELDVIRMLAAGFERDQIYYLLLENSRAFASVGRRWGKYSYVVPNQWQGRFEDLRVIGDKRGGATVLQISHHPEYLEQVLNTFGSGVRFVHVARNPFDNIATVFRKQQPHWSLDDSIDFYFRLSRTIQQIRETAGAWRVVDVQYPRFVADPRRELAGICSFLEVDASPGYLDDCAGIVSGSLPKSRHSIEWPSEAIERIQVEMRGFDFLADYSFET